MAKTGSKVLTVEFQEFRRDIDSYSKAITSMEQAIKGLEEDVAVLNVSWKGAANSMFITKYMKDLQVLREALMNLKDEHQDLEDAYQKYNDSEKAVNDIIQAIKI